MVLSLSGEISYILVAISMHWTPIIWSYVTGSDCYCMAKYLSMMLTLAK